MAELIIIYTLIAAAAFWVWRIQKKRQKQREAASFIRTKLTDINTAVAEFSQLLSLTNGYFPNHQLQLWKSRYAVIGESLVDLPEDTSLITLKKMLPSKHFAPTSKTAKV